MNTSQMDNILDQVLTWKGNMTVELALKTAEWGPDVKGPLSSLPPRLHELFSSLGVKYMIGCDQANNFLKEIINHQTGQCGAFYNQKQDVIHLPPLEQFKTEDGMIRVALHELCHWSAHESRLNRFAKPNLDNPIMELIAPLLLEMSYYQEEVTAELQAALISHLVGRQPNIDRSGGYVQSYVKNTHMPQEIIKKCAERAKTGAKWLEAQLVQKLAA